MSVQTKILTVLTLLGSLIFIENSYAVSEDWICKEAASIRTGNFILSCGVGQAKEESDARESALQNAKREFNQVCNQSDDCRGHKINVVPLRNTCDERDGIIQCYRGFKYEILGERKSERELAQLEPENQVQDAAPVIPKKFESEMPWRLMFGIGYMGTANSNAAANGYFCCGTFDFTAQRDLFWRVHLALRYSYQAGGAGNTTTTGIGTPNSSSNYVTSSSGNEFALSLPVETFDHWYLVPEVGYLTGTTTYTAQNYGASGQGTWSTATTQSSYHNSFAGGQIRYQSGLIVSEVGMGVYVSGGYRQYFNGNGVINSSVGLMFGF